MNNNPKISKWTSLFKNLTDKDFKEKNHNQIRLIEAIKKGSMADIDGLLDNKLANPNDPVWFTKKTKAFVGYAQVNIKEKIFISPMQYALNYVEENHTYQQKVLQKLIASSGTIKESDIDPQRFLQLGRTHPDMYDYQLGAMIKTVKLVSQQGVDWSKVYIEKSEFNKEYLAERLLGFMSKEKVLEAGMGWDNTTNTPFNAFTQPEKLKKDNSVTCLSVNSQFAPVTFTHIIEQTLGLSKDQAKEMTDNLVSGKEIVVPFVKHEQALQFCRMMEELGVFTSSPTMAPKKMVGVADVLVLNREKKEKQEKPVPMFSEAKNTLS